MNEHRQVPLLLMADYGSDPLWYLSSDGMTEHMIPLDQLPLSNELKTALRDWATRYEDPIHTGYQWPSNAEKTSWIEEGRALLTPITQELGSGYDLTYIEQT